jgi:hypothetical protein
MSIPRSGRIASVAAELFYGIDHATERITEAVEAAAAEELRGGGDLPPTVDPGQIINWLSA